MKRSSLRRFGRDIAVHEQLRRQPPDRHRHRRVEPGRHAKPDVHADDRQPGVRVRQLERNGYAFDQDFELLSLGGVDGNACGFWGCGGASKVVVDLGNGKFEYQLNSNGVGGSEPHGALRFTGAFDTVSWRSSTNEFWNGFTVGVQGSAAEVFEPPPVPAIPEPATVALMSVGLGLVAAARRRANRRT